MKFDTLKFQIHGETYLNTYIKECKAAKNYHKSMLKEAEQQLAKALEIRESFKVLKAM